MRMKWNVWCVYKWLFCVSLILEGGVTLKNLTIHVPMYVISGQSATLRCTYDLEGAPLYSIRWYKRQVEFYRFVPRELPPTRVFEEVMPNARIEVNNSDDHQVTISNLHRELSGEYQCEVSGDAPLFHTEIKVASLQVVELPTSPTFLTVDATRYSVGDRIRANCSTGHAYPAANITWTIEGEKKPNTHTISMRTSAEKTDFDKLVSFSTIELWVQEPGFVAAEDTRAGSTDTSKSVHSHNKSYLSVNAPKTGEITLMCSETIFDVHISTVSKTLKEYSPRPASVTGDNSSGRVLTSTVTLAILNLFLCV